jgi:hypothetical protein
MKTKVIGDFEGCEFDKIIAFDNDLVFQCRTYSYTYAYKPDVTIVTRSSGYEVFIHGKKYSGTLYHR